MALLRPYITAEDLRLALSTPTYLALCDDEQRGVIGVVDASPEVALIRSRAHAMVVARVPVVYGDIPDTIIPDQIPQLLRHAELNYACALAYDRHPEYQRTFGTPKYKAEAELIMEQLQAAILRVVDNPPEAVPENVGGAYVAGGPRVFFDANGNYSGGDF